MKQRKIPMRRCVGCMESKPKKELIRIVCTKEGELSIDRVGKAMGRGAYLCDDPECFKKAEKRNAIQRSLERELPEDKLNIIYEELKKRGQ